MDAASPFPPRKRSVLHRLTRRWSHALCGRAARGLTAGEAAALRGVFGDGIDLTHARIVAGAGRNPDAALALNIGCNPALAEGDAVYVHRSCHRPDFSLDPAGVNLLVHEFTHVWQYQHLGFRAFFARYAIEVAHMRNRARLYDHASRDHDFARETIEGQAQMVGDYAGHRAGERRLTQDQANRIAAKLSGTGLFGL